MLDIVLIPVFFYLVIVQSRLIRQLRQSQIENYRWEAAEILRMIDKTIEEIVENIPLGRK